MKEDRQGDIRFILGRVLAHKRRLVFFVFVSLGAALFWGVPVIVLRDFLDAVLVSGDRPLLLLLSTTLLICWIFIGYFMARRQVATRWLADRTTADLVNEAAGVLLGRPLSYFGRMRTGDLISRVVHDAQASGQTAFLLLTIMQEPPVAIAVVIAVVYMNWWLAFIGLIGFPLAAYPLILIGRRIMKASKKARELTADMTDTMVQLFAGIKVVKSYRLEEPAVRDFETTVNGIFTQRMSEARASSMRHPIVEFVNGLGVVAVVMLGGIMVASGRLTPGTLITFVPAFIILHRPIRTIAVAYTQLRDFMPGLVRLRELLEAGDGESDGRRETPALKSEVRFAGVSFSYDRETVLRDVTIEIPSGSFTAIVGPTGSGKTTLLDLMMRFYRPTDGRVLYDGVSLNESRQASLLSRLAYAPQNPVLFNVSIRENVRMGRPSASDEEVEEACRIAGIHDEIAAFKDGYDTLAGESGGALSGGQRQRVALARAVIREADIYVFDEPASALDAASEAALYERLLSHLKGRTIVLVTHRLAVLEKADKVIVVSGGRIEAAGAHRELLDASPTYRSLHQQPGPGNA